MTVQPPYVLLMEDNPLDVFLLEAAFELAQVQVDLQVVQDGAAGLEALETACREHRLPKMVILDYNMPKLNGAEVLARLRQDARLSELRVVMLTTSRAHEAQIRALQADDYLIKPEGVAAAQEIVRKLAAYWQEEGVREAESPFP